jgi:undecaprenyl-diphosphatase
MSSLDASLFRGVNRLADHTSWAHGVAAAYAKLGVVLFGVLLLAGWWRARARGDMGSMAAVLWAGAGCLVAVGLNQILGGWVDRARPYAAMPNVHVLVSRTTDSSFPSDHAVAVGAVAAGLLIADRRLGLVAAVLALVMAFARVYVGAHYPGDVVAGLAVGAVVVMAGGLLALPALRALVGAVDRSPLRPVVRGRAATQHA